MKRFARWLLCVTGLLACGIHELRAADADWFGITKLHPTIPNGREWHAQWEQARVLRPYELDPADKLFHNSEGELRITNGVAVVKPGLTRLMVLTPKGADGHYTAPLWTNVEMTVYARRGAVTRKIDYQALDLSARSGERHNDEAPCEGTSYHATARFDGQCGFKKEIWHIGGYTKLRPNTPPKPWKTVPEGKWVGLKHVVRNCDGNQHVWLQLYLDAEANGEWKLVSEYKDDGNWRGEKAGCDRPQNYIITEGRPAVYFRTDYANVEVKQFSVREIEAAP